MRKSSTVHLTEVMKPQIWEKFPEDLFENVLARLPIVTIIRFRAVCQQWNNLISSQSFSQFCAQVSQENPCFYTTFGDYDYEAMYDPYMKRWYYPNTLEFSAFPVSSAGGLVCFQYECFNTNLCVCNPMTKSFKKLPNGWIAPWCHLGMTMNGSADHRVLKLGCRKYEIYDSVTKCWSHLGKIPECIKGPGCIISTSISIDNTLYFMHKHQKIVSYDTSTGVWTQHLIQAPLHSSGLTLAVSDGKIMLVGMLEENDATFVCIWEVLKMTFTLKEIDRKSLLEFHRRPVGLTCVGNKGLLLCCLKSCNMYRMIIYNIATREWLKVQLPFRRKVLEQNLVRATAFLPCLTAMP